MPSVLCKQTSQQQQTVHRVTQTYVARLICNCQQHQLYAQLTSQTALKLTAVFQIQRSAAMVHWSFLLYLQEPKRDYGAVRAAIENLLDVENYDDGSYGPILVRLAWHASGTYDKATNTGGSNGATMRSVLRCYVSAVLLILLLLLLLLAWHASGAYDKATNTGDSIGATMSSVCSCLSSANPAATGEPFCNSLWSCLLLYAACSMCAGSCMQQQVFSRS